MYIYIYFCQFFSVIVYEKIWNFPGKNTAVSRHSLLQGNSRPRDQTLFPELEADSLPAELPGKIKFLVLYSKSLLFMRVFSIDNFH